VRFAASLASAPMTCLREVVEQLQAAGADMLHFDIEDGTFIPMMTLGTRIIGELRPLSPLPFDVHLAVKNPEWMIPQVISLGANWVSVHWEACPYPHRTLGMIRDQGGRAGLAFNPGTPLPDLRYLKSVVDFVLLLSTEPEYPDAGFLPEVLAKIRTGRTMLSEGIDWVVDGGIQPDNVGRVARAGASIVVAGRSIFQNGEVSDNLAALRRAAVVAQSI
jgi:ribulose-phosphate 3-epimerase